MTDDQHGSGDEPMKSPAGVKAESAVARPSRRALWSFATIASIAYGVSAYFALREEFPSSGLILIAFLFGVPLAMGAIAKIVAWRDTGSKPIQMRGLFGINLCIQLLTALFVLHEAWVCIVIVTPVWILLFSVGWVIGHAIMAHTKRRTTRLSVVAFPLLPLVLLPLDAGALAHSEIKTVSNRMVIDAPPERVWDHLVEVRNIRATEREWTFSHAVLRIPPPVDARLDKREVGGVRTIRWGEAASFQEIVTQWETNAVLGWRFSFPDDSLTTALDPHVRLDQPYLTVLDGSYRLTPLRDGRTLVTLRSRYRLKTPINRYFAAWGQVIVGDFQSDILHVIAGRVQPDRSANPTP